MLLNTKEEREKFIKDVLNEVYVNAIDQFKKDFATKQNLYMFFVNEISEEFITLNDFILSMLKKMLEAKNIENLIKVLISFTIKLETEFQIQEKKKLEAIPIVKEQENDLSMLLSSIQSNNTDLSTIMEEHIVVDDGSSEIEKLLEENHKRLEEEKFFSQNATSNELLVKKTETLEKDNINENYLNSEKQIEEVDSLNETIIDSQENLNNLLSNYDNISSSSETILNEEENETIINNIHSSNGVGLHNDIYSTNRIGLHENNNLSYENEVNEISETTNTYSNNEIELLEDNKEIINDQMLEEDNSELENLLSNYEDDFVYQQETIKYEDEYEEEELDFNELNFDDNTSYSSNNENKLEENNENSNNTKINENESNNLNSLLMSMDNENQVKDDLSINFNNEIDNNNFTDIHSTNEIGLHNNIHSSNGVGLHTDIHSTNRIGLHDKNEETTNEDLNSLLVSMDNQNKGNEDLNIDFNNDTYSSNILQENQETTNLIENDEINSIEDLLSNINNEDEVELNFDEIIEENNEFKNINSLNEINQEQEKQEIDFSENNNLDITFNKKEEIKDKEIDNLKELPLNKNNEETNKIFYQNATSNELLVKKELEKIINTKTPFVQKEDIINKEPKSVVDLIFQDLPKTNIINDDKLLSPIEVSEYIFKLLEEIEVLKDKINKLEKQNT